MRKSRDYAALAAGMHRQPTFGEMEEVIKRDFPLKLPNRNYITLWNSPELTQFRGVEDAIEGFEERVHKQREMDEEIRTVARENGVNTVDLSHVAAALQRQETMMGAMEQHQNDLAEHTRRQQEGMRHEVMAQMQVLAEQQRQAQQRAAMAEEVSRRHVDTVMADRDRLATIVENTSGGTTNQYTTNNIDNRVTNNNSYHTTQMLDQSIHNQAITMMRSHADQFGQYMHQQRLSQEQMMQLLFEHIRRNQRPEIQLQILGGGSPPPPPPPGAGAIMASSGPPSRRARRPRAATPYEPAVGPSPPPPPPPPSSGALAIENFKPPPAPAVPSPTPAPTIPKARPPRKIQEAAAPEAPKRPRGRPRKDATARIAEPPPPPPPPAPPAPGPTAPLVAPEVPKAVPKAKAKSASKRSLEPTMPNVLRKEPAPNEPVAKRPRGRPRKQPQADAPQVFDISANDGNDGPPKGRNKKVIKKVPVVKQTAKALGGEESVPKPSARPTRPNRSRKVPEAAPETRKAPSRKVKIDDKPKDTPALEKKKRGRPPGSRNKKSLAVTQQLEKVATTA